MILNGTGTRVKFNITPMQRTREFVYNYYRENSSRTAYSVRFTGDGYVILGLQIRSSFSQRLRKLKFSDVAALMRFGYERLILINRNSKNHL